MDDRLFQQLLNAFDLSWEGYRKVRKGVKKRIGRHMQQQGYRELSDYLSGLDRNPRAREECERLLTVSISRFFRDRHLWDILEGRILPALVENQPHELFAWSAGCACGEEVYSLKIVWDRLHLNHAPLPKLKITATDLNPAYIQKAETGIYTPGSLKGLPADLKSDYFEPIPGQRRLAIKKFLKNHIDWKVRHLLNDPPERPFQIIFLRNNLLTYYQAHLKRKAFEKILHALTAPGVLIIGSHEALPYLPPDMQPFPGYSYIFLKKGIPI